MNLPDRYRPRVWSDVAGHAKPLADLDRIRHAGGLAGRGYWISGPSGIGKTTITRLLAAEVSDEWGIVELDSPLLTPTRLAEIERTLSLRPLGRGTACIVNEAQALDKDSLTRLLTIFDDLPRWSTWIFTSMGESADDAKRGPAYIRARSALIGRTTHLALAVDVKAFASRAQEIARCENLDGQPLTAYEALILRCHGSLREALQAIETGAMLGDGPTISGDERTAYGRYCHTVQSGGIPARPIAVWLIHYRARQKAQP